jgi:hypothetical protein
VEPPLPPPDARSAVLERPRSLGQILDTAFDLLRRNAPLFVGLAALVHVPLAFATVAVLPERGSAAPASEPAAWAWAALAFALGALPIVMGGLTDAYGALLRGRTVDAGTALRTGLGLALPLIATLFVLGLALLATLVPFGLLRLVGASLPASLRVAGALAALLLPVVLMLRLSLVSQVVVLEHLLGPRALIRAHQLIEGQVLRVFGTLVLVGILMGLLGGAAEFALRDLPAIGPAATGLVQALGFAYTTAVGVVLYADVRVRRGEHAARPGVA